MKRRRIKTVDQRLAEKRKELALILSAEKRIKISKAYSLLKMRTRVNLLEAGVEPEFIRS